MKIRLACFNIYLLLFLVGWVGCKTKTPEERKQAKEASTLRVFLEANRGGGGSGGGTAIYRQNPIHLDVEHEPLLTETDLASAAVVDLPGGFGIEAQFNGHGALILEGATVAHHGQHLAIQSHFGETRWLAAPVITRRISNGDLVFTPDATREEAERIVRGLTNVINKVKEKDSGF